MIYLNIQLSSNTFLTARVSPFTLPSLTDGQTYLAIKIKVYLPTRARLEPVPYHVGLKILLIYFNPFKPLKHR